MRSKNRIACTLKPIQCPNLIPCVGEDIRFIFIVYEIKLLCLSCLCRLEVIKLQQCSRKLIVNRCYSSLYALYPKLREAVEKMMDVTLKQVNKASFYCSDHKMKINWEMIPNAVKKVLPCDKKFFEQSLQCAGKFRAAFNKNKKDPNLCRYIFTNSKDKGTFIKAYSSCSKSCFRIMNRIKIDPCLYADTRRKFEFAVVSHVLDIGYK